MNATNRTYRNAESGHNCRLYTSNDASRFHLIYEGNPPEAPANGCEVNGFYLAAHTGVTIKLNTGKQITLKIGEFYNLKEGERITHKKYTGFNKFTKA